MSGFVENLPALERVTLAAGGTGGHIYPGLAVAEALRTRFPGIDILFVGTAKGLESNVIPRAGFRLELVKSQPYYGASLLGRARGSFDLPRGILQARRAIAKHDSQLVLGFGGFSSVAAVVAGKSLGLPTLIHESNALPGMANQLLARLATDVLIGMEGTEFRGRSARMTGNPVRREIARLRSVRRGSRGAHRTRLLVTGGSLGAQFLNLQAPKLCAELRKLGVELEIWHQAGEGSLGLAERAYAAVGIEAKIEAYIDDMARGYAWADVALARCGSSTLAELSAASLPALLVPLLGHARDHQLDNARRYVDSGAGWLASETEWHASREARRLADLLSSDHALNDAATNAGLLTDTNACDRIIDACLDSVSRLPGRRSRANHEWTGAAAASA